jgi:hypothetical protein
VTYSFAISGAYELESKRAVHPRIVIDKNIILMFKNPEAGLDYSSLVQSGLVIDTNGTFFLNVIDDTNWVTLYDAASKLFMSDSPQILEDEQAFAKHVWFENHLFQSMHRRRRKRYIPSPIAFA